MGTLGVQDLEHGVMSSKAVWLGIGGRAASVASAGQERLAQGAARSRRRLDASPRFPRARGPVLSRSLQGAAIMTTREAFLDRVRQAVAEGNRAGAIPKLPERGNIGYQGAGADPAE